jgi:copper chaperone CopZ
MSEGRQSIRTAQTKILIYHLRRRNIMKKTYKIDVDCANCANKMEEATKKTPGVKDAVVNFMALKMKVEFEDGADVDSVMQQVVKNCKVVEDDCQIFL